MEEFMKNKITDKTFFVDIGLQPVESADDGNTCSVYKPFFEGLLEISKVKDTATEALNHFKEEGFRPSHSTKAKFSLDSNSDKVIMYSASLNKPTCPEFEFTLTVQIFKKGDVAGEEFQEVVQLWLDSSF
jgi:hypothetical protein